MQLSILLEPLGAVPGAPADCPRLPPGLCFGSPNNSLRNGWRGTAGTKADFRSMPCCASSPTRMSICSMRTRRGECACALFPNQTSGGNDHFGSRDGGGHCCMARSYLVLAVLAAFSSRPTALTKSLACSLSNPSEANSLVAENLNPKRSKFSYREKPTKKQENHKAKLTNYHGGLSSFRKHRPRPTLSSTPFSRRQVSVTLAQASSVPRLLVSILQTLLSLSHSSLEQQTPLHI